MPRRQRRIPDVARAREREGGLEWRESVLALDLVRVAQREWRERDIECTRIVRDFAGCVEALLAAPERRAGDRDTGRRRMRQLRVRRESGQPS